MDERVMQFRVGVMVVAVTIIAATLIPLFGEVPGIGQDTYTVYVDFTRAPGVTRDTPVRKNGILIGRVTRVELKDDGVLVTATINRRVDGSPVNLRQNELCQISGSLLGDKALEFVASGRTDLPNDVLTDGALVRGTVAADPLEVIGNLEGGLAVAIDEVAKTSAEIGRMARRLNDVLDTNDEQVSRIIAKTEQTIDQISSTVGGAENLLGDPEFREKLRQSVDELPAVLAEAKGAMSQLKTTVEGVDRNMKNLEGLTEPLGERGGVLIDNLDRATGKLDQVLGQLVTFSERLNDPETSIGQLLNDTELYGKLDETVSNINRITRDIRPILRDARVFADKLARHPESIGLGGALRRGSGLK